MKLTLLPLSTNYPIKVFNCVGLHEVHENETHDHMRNVGWGDGKEKKGRGGGGEGNMSPRLSNSKGDCLNSHTYPVHRNLTGLLS